MLQTEFPNHTTYLVSLPVDEGVALEQRVGQLWRIEMSRGCGGLDRQGALGRVGYNRAGGCDIGDL